MQNEIIRTLNTADGSSYLLQPFFFWPFLVASVIISITVIVAYICIRKSRNDAQNAACKC